MPNQLNIHGQGGQFPCFWLDNAGGAPWSDIASYNFNAMPTAPYDWRGTSSGSYGLSDRFHVNAGQQVNVAAILATAHTKPFWDFGFALLVQGTTVVDVLFALRPDGVHEIGDTGPNVNLAAPSAGVTFTQTQLASPYGGPMNATGIVLNGVDYGSLANAGCGDIATYVSSKVKPAAGEYQILFGMFATLNLVNHTRPAAMVVPFFNVTQG
jgi:hypothetical protein